MLRFIYIIACLLLMFMPMDMEAGNPDRQGESGAAQLLMNPWARSAGLHGMNTANIYGVEALRINVAGLCRIDKTQLVASHTRYLEGTDIGLNAVGIAQKMGKNGAFGINIMAVDVGDIPVTTELQPEGTGGTYSPSLFNMGLSYAHMFENKVSVGVTFRFVSESISDVAASSFAIDAGVQYVSGPQDNFKIGISLRNVGAPMIFKGQGLSEVVENPDGEIDYDLTYFQRAQKLELPSMVNIGTSYDFVINPKNHLTLLGNFTANSFSQDQIGGGAEYSFNKMFMLRAAYKYEFGSTSEGGEQAPVYSGLSAGLSFEVPLKKGSDKTFGLDYAYRDTKLWSGSHTVSLRFNL